MCVCLQVSSSSKRIDGELVGFYPFVVSHPDSTKAYYLASTSQEDTDDWIKALRYHAPPTHRQGQQQTDAWAWPACLLTATYLRSGGSVL